MRNILALLLALSLFGVIFSGCSPTDKIADAGNDITSYSSDGKTTELGKDESIEGTLTIDFMGAVSDDYVSRAQKMYKEYYPNVELTLSNDMTTGFEERVKRIQTEIMSGRGPDVFVALGEANDLEKSMRAGAYADLTDFFANDAAFNIEDFNKGVLYSGQVHGKQYLVPLTYYAPIILTTQDVVERTGFNKRNCKDYLKTGEELGRVLTENKLNCEPAEAFHSFDAAYYWTSYAGIDWLDYDAESVNLEQNEVKAVFEQLKRLSPYSLIQKGGYQRQSNRYLYELFQDDEILFAQLKFRMMDFLTYDIPAMLGAGQEPIIFPYKNMSGGLAAKANLVIAVNNNSESKESGYRFIKMLMSPDFNVVDDGNGKKRLMDSGMPVSNAAMQEMLVNLQQAPNKGTPQEGYLFLNGNPVKGEGLSADFVNSFMECVRLIDSVEFDSPIAYLVMDKMKPYLYDGSDYDKCIQNAQQAAEIFISE